jgi:mannan polymerase II complex MNN11 subunit
LSLLSTSRRKRLGEREKERELNSHRKVAMQFALPPRKSSHNPPYARSPRITLLRRRQLKTVGLIAFAVLTVFYLLSYLFSSSSSGRPTSSTKKVSIPAGTPKAVLVTVFDRENLTKEYLEKIQRNREVYAAQHGTYTAEPPLVT